MAHAGKNRQLRVYPRGRQTESRTRASCGVRGCVYANVCAAVPGEGQQPSSNAGIQQPNQVNRLVPSTATVRSGSEQRVNRRQSMCHAAGNTTKPTALSGRQTAGVNKRNHKGCRCRAARGAVVKARIQAGEPGRFKPQCSCVGEGANQKIVIILYVMGELPGLVPHPVWELRRNCVRTVMVVVCYAVRNRKIEPQREPVALNRGCGTAKCGQP